MLEGKAPTSFSRALFVTENAYLGDKLSYEDFQKQIKWLTHLVKIVASNDGFVYDRKDRQQVLLSSAIYRVIKDSLYFEDLFKSKSYVKERYTYDFDDFWGERDWSKMFVTKLLNSNSGNCHSLPALYKVLADEINVKAWLALAPNHTYVKQWNEKTGWYNTELTTGQFPFDADIKANNYIKTEAIADGIYMDTLSSKESIAYVMVDLAQGYLRKFSYEDVETPLSWVDNALRYFPDYVNGLILKAELQKIKFEKSLKARGIENVDLLRFKNELVPIESAYLKVHDIGYRKMPKEMYLNWLFRVQKESTKDSFEFDSPQPFKDYGYKVPVITAGDGKNYEFFDQEEVIRIGSMELNVRARKLIAFVSQPDDEMPDDVIGRMYDPALGKWWQIDPKSEKFYNDSPYSFVFNNPINFTDPDGQSGEAQIDKNSKTVTVNSHMVFYGSEANATMAKASSAEIQNMYNAAGGTVSIGGDTYSVKYNITYEVVSEGDAETMAFKNTSAANNFIRVEATNADGRSNMELGGNTGSWVTSDKLGKSTTAAHEAGHGYGLEHSSGDQRGKGAPDIMAARGTKVDSKYQYDPKAPTSATGSTVNPVTRVVKQENITNMFKGVTFDKSGKANIGSATNTIYDKNGNPK